ncbi:trihelix transcription factor ASR3-like [Salvia miltiorrhiza]|uniref:trihelix transcription factor ASR3-like n=1 Tax=Salvia miltiorrhiza TaxID=226208 RepID=UPI0025ABCBF9|nr:trihelix transcription factor ASR3-like [Salvia miltiorrhiza]
MMRSDFRRERKLPGFFDRQVYDVLDGKDFAGAAYQLALVTVSAYEDDGDGLDDEDEMVDSEEAEEASPGKEKLQQDDTIPSPVPISEMKHQPSNANQATGKKNFWRDEDGVKKRKRVNNEVDSILINALERNNELLRAQLEDQKSNFQLAREEHKEQHERLVAALTKITGALEKIADKL